MKFGGVLVMGFHSTPKIAALGAGVVSGSDGAGVFVANEADTFLSTTY